MEFGSVNMMVKRDSPLSQLFSRLINSKEGTIWPKSIYTPFIFEIAWSTHMHGCDRFGQEVEEKKSFISVMTEPAMHEE